MILCRKKKNSSDAQTHAPCQFDCFCRQTVCVRGEGNPDPGTRGVFAQTEVYDPISQPWKSLKTMAVPVHGTGAASL